MPRARRIFFAALVGVLGLPRQARADAAPPAPPPTATTLPPPAVAPSAAAAPASADSPPEAPPPEVPSPEAPPRTAGAAAQFSEAPQAPVKVRAIDVRASSEVTTYADTDHVYVISPTVAAVVTNPVAGWSVGGRYLVDVVSAASVDIVSTASRRWSEVRQVGAVDGSYKPGELGVSGSAHVSIEPDYQSYTGGGTISRDLNDKNLTLVLGYSHGHDVAGRTGTPFSVFSRTLDVNGFKGGGTFLLSSSSVLSVVGDFIHESGDPSKPYRYVPMFAPGTQVPRGASIDFVTQQRLSGRVLEQLPLQRDRVALTARYAHRFASATVRLDQRAYMDSWGLKASTSDARLIFDVGRRVSLGPHLRVHAQAPVVFWERAYVMRPGSDIPALRTGDRELGPLLNFTGGGTIRFNVGPRQSPHAWVLGLDIGVTSTHYLDDIYINQRLSGVSSFVLEADL